MGFTPARHHKTSISIAETTPCNEKSNELNFMMMETVRSSEKKSIEEEAAAAAHHQYTRLYF